MNSPYINSYGLLNAKLADDVAENSPLWSLEYLLLKHDSLLLENLVTFIRSSHTQYPGLYNQRPFVTDSPDDYMSPDQLIAFVGALKLADASLAIKHIWRYLRSHFFTYDNLTGKTNFDRTMQLSAISFVGVCAGKWWWLPLLSAVCIWSCITNKTQTSGRLKAWVMSDVTGLSLTRKVMDFFVNRHWGSWKNVFFEYFKEEEHPIRSLL